MVTIIAGALLGAIRIARELLPEVTSVGWFDWNLASAWTACSGVLVFVALPAVLRSWWTMVFVVPTVLVVLWFASMNANAFRPSNLQFVSFIGLLLRWQTIALFAAAVIQFLWLRAIGFRLSHIDQRDPCPS